jgi:thiol:disulfide interchange protein DsbA
MTFAAHSFASRRRFNLALLAVGTSLALGGGHAFAQLVEGKNYERIKNPQPVESGNKIEVIEFFSYGCPHCAELEPFLETWLAKAPQDVAFRRVPVVFQQRWEPLGKIYYTLDALGEERKL